MPVEPSREAVTDVQDAAREMIGAARKFLDAMEDFVSDEIRVSRALVDLTDVLHATTDLISRVAPGTNNGSNQPVSDSDVVSDVVSDDGDVEPNRPRFSRVRRITVTGPENSTSAPSDDFSARPGSGR